VEILLWLVPPVVVTAVAMLWVSWVGRERRELDRDEVVRRMGAALDKDAPRRAPKPVARRVVEPSSGVAVRRTPPPEPEAAQEPADEPAAEPGEREDRQRRAS
jgi:hypothetical protein